jgi:hypothetical protein
MAQVLPANIAAAFAGLRPGAIHAAFEVRRVMDHGQ